MKRKRRNKKEQIATPKFLLESTVANALALIFPHTTDWIRNKNFRGCNFRPDYRSDSLKMCIEFDGYQHYTKAKCAIDDMHKDEAYKAAGYKVVRIPYFVQLSKKTIKLLFGVSIPWKQDYPHGFISKEPTMKLPADFCELGIKRFLQDLNTFSVIKCDIIESLKLREEPIDLVLPPSLQSLIAA